MNFKIVPPPPPVSPALAVGQLWRRKAGSAYRDGELYLVVKGPEGRLLVSNASNGFDTYVSAAGGFGYSEGDFEYVGELKLEDER